MSVLYPNIKELMWQAGVNLATADVRAVLIDTGVYTYNAAHTAYDDLSGVIGTESGAFTTKTFVGGLLDADDIVFSLVPGGADAEALVIFINTGVAANDLLVAYIDSAVGLPVNPNGGDVNIGWHATGIAQL